MSQKSGMKKIKELLALGAKSRIIRAKNASIDFRVAVKGNIAKISTLGGWTARKTLNMAKKYKIDKTWTQYKYCKFLFSDDKRRKSLPSLIILNLIFGGFKNFIKAVQGLPYDPNERRRNVKRRRSEEMRLKVKQNKPLLKNPEYQLKTIIKYGLWKQSDYLSMFNKHPDIIPSISMLKSQWGNFSTMKEMALRYAFSGQMMLFFNLVKKLKRMPTALECKAIGVSLEEIQDKFGNSFDVIQKVLEYSEKGTTPIDRRSIFGKKR